MLLIKIVIILISSMTRFLQRKSLRCVVPRYLLIKIVKLSLLLFHLGLCAQLILESIVMGRWGPQLLTIKIKVISWILLVQKLVLNQLLYPYFQQLLFYLPWLNDLKETFKIKYND